MDRRGKAGRMAVVRIADDQRGAVVGSTSAGVDDQLEDNSECEHDKSQGEDPVVSWLRGTDAASSSPGRPETRSPADHSRPPNSRCPLVTQPPVGASQPPEP